MKTCLCSPCPYPAFARKMCRSHYGRWRYTGVIDPSPIQPHGRSLSDRFFAHVTKTDTCWLWNGSRTRRHYGNFKYQGKPVLAHRLSFYLATGRWPEPFCLHACDNPPCVNPAHLFEGTQRDNMHDMAVKQRAKSGYHFGSKHYSTHLLERDVTHIRQLIAQGVSQRSLAKQFGVHHATINAIHTRKNWKHIP